MAARARPLGVLVLHMHLTALPMRPTMASQLRFLEHGRERHRIAYLNLAGRCPPWIRAQRWDLVVLHYSLLAARWTPQFGAHPLLARLAGRIGRRGRRDDQAIRAGRASRTGATPMPRAGRRGSWRSPPGARPRPALLDSTCP
jgi:hypothetical protein